MSTKHTPGPWQIATGNRNREFNRWSVRSEKHPLGRGGVFPVANVNYTNHPMGQANARLITAAPELLEALQAIHDSAPACWWSLPIEQQQRIKAAIAKATGSEA